MHLVHSPAQQPPFKCTSDWDRFYFQRLCPIIITATLIKKCKTDRGRHGWDLRGKFNRNQCFLRITLFSAHKLHRSSLSVPALAEASFPSSTKLGRNPIFFRKSEMEDSPKLHIITIWLRGICSETFQLFDFNQSFLATLGNVIVLFPFLRNSELPDSIGNWKRWKCVDHMVFISRQICAPNICRWLRCQILHQITMSW